MIQRERILGRLVVQRHNCEEGFRCGCPVHVPGVRTEQVYDIPHSNAVCKGVYDWVRLERQLVGYYIPCQVLDLVFYVFIPMVFPVTRAVFSLINGVVRIISVSLPEGLAGTAGLVPAGRTPS